MLLIGKKNCVSYEPFINYLMLLIGKKNCVSYEPILKLIVACHLNEYLYYKNFYLF